MHDVVKCTAIGFLVVSGFVGLWVTWLRAYDRGKRWAKVTLLGSGIVLATAALLLVSWLIGDIICHFPA